jgi:glycine cleavage system transcriptional repressor
LGQFAGIFSAEAPAGLDPAALSADLGGSLAGEGLSAWAAPVSAAPEAPAPPAEPYIITISGPDSPGLIPTITSRVASFDANIDNLRSVALSGGEGSPPPVVLVLEVSLPAQVQRHVFREALSLAAEELGLEISLQHRDIFEAVNRV